MKAIRDLMNMGGRVAVVTGGCGHIGRAICDSLAELGAGIVVLDLEADRCASAASEISEAYGVPTFSCAADLSDDEDVRGVPGRVATTMGRLDVIVHSAAVVGSRSLEGWRAPFEEQSISAWRLAVETNLTAVFLLTQASHRLLRRSGHASVINIGSIYGVVGPDWSLYEGTDLASPAAYAASKGGLLQLTRWLATTLAPEVRVNAISPGGIFRETPEPFLSRYSRRTPMGRMGTEEDIKGAAAFLASDMSAYVTGQNLLVDGGWTAW